MFTSKAITKVVLGLTASILGGIFSTAYADGGGCNVPRTLKVHFDCPAGQAGSIYAECVHDCPLPGKNCAVERGPYGGSWKVKSNTCRPAVSFSHHSFETTTNVCPAPKPTGVINMRRDFEVWSDGSYRNHSAWYETGRTCTNQNPVAIARTLTTAEDTPGSVTLTATDDHSSFSFEIVIQPENGTASISGSKLTFTPDSDWNGNTSLTYRAKDPHGGVSAPATVSITVTPVNDAPIARNQTLTTPEDTPKSITLSATDIDSPAPTLFEVITPPNENYGSVVLIDSVVTFSPAKDWHGSTSFTYRAQDSSGAWSDPATVTITVTPVNDPPIVKDAAYRTNNDVAKTISLTVADPDVDDAHAFKVLSTIDPSVGQATITGSTLVFTPAEGWIGTTSFTYEVTDGEGEKDTASMSISSVRLYDVESACATPLGGEDFIFRVEDAGETGLDVNSLQVNVDFGDGALLAVPLSIQDAEAIKGAQGEGNWPSTLVATTELSPELTERFNSANYVPASAGGQAPYTFTITVMSRDGKTRSHIKTYDPIVREDTQAPEITIFSGPEDGAGDLLRFVNDTRIMIKDDKVGVDNTATQFYLSINDKRVPFFIRPDSEEALSSNRCVARKPLTLQYSTGQMAYDAPEIMDLLVDAYTSKQPLSFEVEVEDFAGNRATAKRELQFAPDVLTVAGVKIPGVAHTFNRTNGSPVVSINAHDAALDDGASVDYYARLLNDGELELMVNGTQVAGQKVVELGSFTLDHGSRINLELAAVVTGDSGQVTLMLVPRGEGGRLIQVPVSVWYPELELKSNNWTPVQLLEPANADPVQSAADACTLTGVFSIARYADPIANPSCLVEWKQLPHDAYGMETNVPSMTGRIPTPGKHPVSYEVVLFDTDGSRFVLGEGTGEFDVIPAKDVLAFSLGDKLDNSYRIVRDVTGRLTQDAGPSCGSITTDEDFAMDLSAFNRPACLITWQLLPEGIAQPNWTDDPMIGGSFQQPTGDALFKWSVASYSTKGVRVEFMDSKQLVPLQDPPIPEISMESKNHLGDNLYWTDTNGGLVGDYVVKALNARLKVDLTEAGQITESDETVGSYSDTLTYRSRLLTEQKPLWSRTEHGVHARYSAMPNIEARNSIEVLAVPDQNIRPDVIAATQTPLNTEMLSLTSWMGIPYKDTAYTPEGMGEWEVRLLSFVSTNSKPELAGFKKIDASGKADFELDLLALNSEYVRILPEARLLSPVPEYQRTVTGSRPLYLTILRGQAINSSIDARRIKGEAKLSFMAKIAVENRLDFKALGDVIWELRTLGSGDWEQVENGSKIADRFQYVFDVGQYELRARVLNKNSGAEFVTETVEIHAYSIPKVKIEGPTNAFMGSTAKLRLNAMVDGKEVDEKDLVAQWSEDNGETWMDGGIEYTLTRDTAERVMVVARARMRESPAEWEDSWSFRRHRVGFRHVAPPRGSIVGPRMIEAGETVQWRGTARAPYPRMDVQLEGRFILPDGTVVESDLVEYIATQKDADQERIEVTYEAWIPGYEDQGAKASFTRRVSVWNYEWPQWSFRVRTSATQAPAEVDVRASKPYGASRYLEGVEYKWTLPEGVTIVKEDVDGRVFNVEKPGTYTISVEISDARGNVSVVTQDIVIDEKDPWLVDFRMTASNVDNRAPLDIRFFPNVGGGHPRDRISLYRYLINGETISEGVRYASAKMEAGNHEVTLEIESEFGDVERHSKTVEVKPNTPPTCEMEANESGNRWRFVARCADKTGRVMKHIWTVNGEVLSMGSSRITVSSREDMVAEVRLKAVDDGGAESEEIVWHGSVKGKEE